MTIYTALSVEMPPRTSSSAELVNIAIGLATCAATIAELNCGMGERAGLLSYNHYYGFDGDLINIMTAKQTVQKLNTYFSMVDILHFQSDHYYQTVLALGSLVTADNLGTILAGWRADRYVLELQSSPHVPANLIELFKAKVHHSQGSTHLLVLEDLWPT